MLAGCSTPMPATGDQAAPSQPCFSQQDTARHSLVLRKEAADLREMARRRQAEADVMERKPAPDRERIEQQRRLAQDLLAAAEETEQKARDLERQVPHGMVQ